MILQPPGTWAAPAVRPPPAAAQCWPRALPLRILGGLLFVLVVAGSLWLASTVPPPVGEVLRIGEATFLPSPGPFPGPYPGPFPGPSPGPPESTAGELPVTLPDARSTAAGGPTGAAAYRMHFELAGEPTVFWGVLLPYLYGGGQVWVNGQQLDDILSASERLQVRWERPHLVTVPQHLLRTGRNELWVRVVPVAGYASIGFPAPRVGPLADLRTAYDRRLFWVHTVPRFTVAACLIGAVFVLLTWWRLPDQELYGWFGLGTALWGIRTLTFVMETVPADRWLLWRLVYLATTGGYAIVMAIFAFQLAGIRRRWLERSLLGYWALGPLALLAVGVGGDLQVNRLWTAGLVPISIGALAAALLAVRRQRTLTSLILPTSMGIATLAGVHDYLLVWHRQWLAAIAPDWAEQRYFLLHHGANLLVLAMGLLLSTRFVRTARSLRELNQTLESRIAEREGSLAENFVRLAQLERQTAAAEERQLIMREIHDGLGSRLFTSLSRVERGAMDGPQMADSLRACIAEMRLALDALAPGDQALLAAFGDFMFRWQAELEAAGIRCRWDLDVADDDLRLPPHATLQVLRVAQEALTNVVKHAGATRVDLSLQHGDDRLTLAIEDDGIGTGIGTGIGMGTGTGTGRGTGTGTNTDTGTGTGTGTGTAASGRGLHNMRARAEQLGGTLELARNAGQGTRVVLRLPARGVSGSVEAAGGSLPHAADGAARHPAKTS